MTHVLQLQRDIDREKEGEREREKEREIERKYGEILCEQQKCTGGSVP